MLSSVVVRAREHSALAPILVTAAFLRLFQLATTGQNLYYAAGVRSMLDSWHNFFYASFDPGGQLMLDKPPLGFWLQAATAWVFGFQYWALALPQVVAGVLAVALLYFMVRPRYGATAAVFSALSLAILPASVASARNNSLDTITMLLMLVAAWSVLRAGERRQFRYLALAALLAGLAFNAKMFAAFVPLPALGLSYVATTGTVRRAFVHFVLASVLLAGVSLSWVTAVGLTPPDERPYVLNGYGGSIWALTFRYNGLNRILGSQPQAHVRGPWSELTDGYLGAASLAPRPGPLRLLTGTMGSQLGWFVPLAVGAWLSRSLIVLRKTDPRLLGSDILFGVWCFLGLLFFSVNASLKPQYLEAIAAPVAVGSGLAIAWILGVAKSRPSVALLVAGTVIAYHALLLLILADDTRVLGAALLVTAGLAIAASLGFAVGTRELPVRASWAGLPIGVLLLFVAPFAWAYSTAADPATGSATRYPTAGPDDVRDYAPAPGGDLPTTENTPPSADPVLAFLERQGGKAQFLVGTERSLYGNAARYIILANRPVLTLDIYAQDDEAAAGLSQLVAQGKLRYLELQTEGPWANPDNALGRWFQSACVDITRDGLRPLGGQHLYDCAAGNAHSTGSLAGDS